MATNSCTKKSVYVYRPRRPEKTVLFDIIKKHFTTWKKNTEKPISKYVEEEFKKYLECGILAKGFACARCIECNQEMLIAFSCKRRGLCPSCNTRAMVETAAHLIENVIPCVSVRQWVISFPMRIRHYLQTQKILQAVLKIVVDEIRKRLIACSSNLSNPKIGAVTFIHQFGKTLNFHPHFHLVVADGLFSRVGEDLLFHEISLTPDDIVDTEDCICRRVLRYFCRQGWLGKETVDKMSSNPNNGFSLNANVQIPFWDREGLERLLRYCARPAFKSENLRWNGPWVYYGLPKPTHTGKTFIQLEPLEFLERISCFIPKPRRHRRHYHGVFAPNSPIRSKVTANAKKRPKSNISPEVEEAVERVKKVSLNWAQLIARIYEVDPLICTCGKEMKIIAFVTNTAEIRRILCRIRWPIQLPEFDPPYEISNWDICQLLPWTEDGFSPLEADKKEVISEVGPDPPDSYIDPPFWEDYRDPPHWNDHSDPPFWEE